QHILAAGRKHNAVPGAHGGTGGSLNDVPGEGGITLVVIVRGIHVKILDGTVDDAVVLVIQVIAAIAIEHKTKITAIRRTAVKQVVRTVDAGRRIGRYGTTHRNAGSRRSCSRQV